MLIALDLTAAVSARDEAINKKMFGSGTTTFVIANKERNDAMNRTSLFKNLVYQQKALTKPLKLMHKDKEDGF